MRKYHNVSLQGLELLVTVLLARNRQPLPTVAAGVPQAEFAAKLISLPSGLLAMVCEAIVKLKVLLGPAAARASGGGRSVCGVLEVLHVVSVLDTLQVSDHWNPMWSEPAPIRQARARA